MKVIIKPGPTDGEILVNQTSVRKDMEGNWITSKELSGKERKFFGDYLQLLEVSSAKEVKATFKG